MNRKSRQAGRKAVRGHARDLTANLANHNRTVAVSEISSAVSCGPVLGQRRPDTEMLRPTSKAA